MQKEILLIKNLPIELYKILKITGITSGGEGKFVVAEGYVYLNGEQELQKRKKVYAGDVVTFDEFEWLIEQDDSEPEPQKREKVPPKNKKPARRTKLTLS